MNKLCSKCHKHKPYSEYYKHSSTKDGYRSSCKACLAAQTKTYKKNNKEKVREADRKRYHKNQNLNKHLTSVYQKQKYRTCKRFYLLRKWNGMSNRCKNGGPRNQSYLGLPVLPKEEFLSWALEQPSFHSLWEKWVASGHELSCSPSIDRIDPNKGYVIDNIQFLSLGANVGKKNKSK